MAHFAKLDESNIVIDVIRISNEDLLDENGEESEDIGLDVVRSFTGYDNWIQASYNGNFRNIYLLLGIVTIQRLMRSLPKNQKRASSLMRRVLNGYHQFQCQLLVSGFGVWRQVHGLI